VNESVKTDIEMAEMAATIVEDETMEQKEVAKEVENGHGTEIVAVVISDVVVEIVVENVEVIVTSLTTAEVVEVVEVVDDEAIATVRKEKEALHHQRSDYQHLT